MPEMNLNISAKELDLLKQQIIPLEAKLNKIMQPDVAECIHQLTQMPRTEEHIARLAKDLTIRKTYFFRNPAVYKALEEKIFPEILQAKRSKGQQLNIWSVGCCTGEEPYSVAILLHRLLPDLNKWNIRITGTDVNEEFLFRAREAVYKEWSFRGLPKDILNTYFKENDVKKFALLPEIKKMVRFHYLNLVDRHYRMEKVDVILCNRVMVHFTPQHIRQIIQQFTDALAENGRLLVSPIEVPLIEHPQLIWERYGDTVVFKKKGRIATPAATPKDEITPFAEIQSLADSGDLIRARFVCEAALKTHRIHPTLYYLYGMVLHEMNLPESALQALRHCLFLDPKFIMAHFFLGMLLLQAGRKEEASKQLHHALCLLEDAAPDEILKGTQKITAEQLKFMTEGILKESRGA